MFDFPVESARHDRERYESFFCSPKCLRKNIERITAFLQFHKSGSRHSPMNRRVSHDLHSEPEPNVAIFLSTSFNAAILRFNASRFCSYIQLQYIFFSLFFLLSMAKSRKSIANSNPCPDNDDGPSWYFAYGSNMCSSVFLERRGIRPLKTAVATIPGYILCFEVPGVPYLEPAQGSIRRYRSPKAHDSLDVIGVAYLITSKDMSRIRATEGGGIAYKEVLLEAMLLDEAHDMERAIQVRTLISRTPSSPERRPTIRYLNLLIRGAEENHLPADYRRYLSNLPVFTINSSCRYRIGSATFLYFWRSVQKGLEWGIRSFKDDSGTVPSWFISIFNVLLTTMWFQHDFFFCYLFGRGDGL